MKKFLMRSVLVLGALFATACIDNGSSAPPPTDVKVVPGDGGAVVSWTMASGSEYWVFSAAASSISTENWAVLPQAIAAQNVSSPYFVSGLINGIVYSFTVNARISGGPGGSGSPSISVVPRLAGLLWTAGNPLASSNLKGLGFVALVYPGLYVTVGAGGTAFTSPDAVNWTAVTSIPTASSRCISIGSRLKRVSAAVAVGMDWMALASPFKPMAGHWRSR